MGVGSERGRLSREVGGEGEVCAALCPPGPLLPPTSCNMPRPPPPSPTSLPAHQPHLISLMWHQRPLSSGPVKKVSRSQVP